MNTEPNNATNELSTQVAIVTGGGRGLGRAYVQSLAAAGAKVAIVDRLADPLAETLALVEATGGTACTFTADVTDQPAMAQVVAAVEQQWGPIDVLVNNAAVVTPLGFDWEIDPAEWWRTLEINVYGPFLCTHLVLPSMIARRRGRIVNISSIAAHSIHPYGTAYCASKAALTHMTNLLADAVKAYGIAVFALSPGAPTAMIETIATSPQVPEPVRLSFRQFFETGRGMAESVSMLMFLVSGQADKLTGRYLSAQDLPDDLLHRSEQIVQDDLYTLRLRV